MTLINHLSEFLTKIEIVAE